jgi:DNA-binding response OmpR family regulator
MCQRVLIVDDDDNIRRLEKRVLERSGYQVQQAADGHEAIEHIDKEGYDAMVLDLMMPRVDGFGVIDHLARTNPGMMSRTVIATAFPRDAASRRLDAVCRVIVKPFDIEQLITAVKECVGA